MDIEKLKFPIGTYSANRKPSPDVLHQWINDIEEFPSRLLHLVKDISVEALNWRYRPGGWTVKQVVHHCADSHINSLMRFKLALTEDKPTIRPYFEDRWANLPDGQTDDISASLALLSGLHKRWVVLLHNLSDDQLKRVFVHPDYPDPLNVAETIGSYAWHCNHHLAHVKNGIGSNGKYN